MTDECIVFTVTGEHAHFRKPHTTSPALTFGVPPRTTVAGMIAAVLGLPRDSYYDTFGRGVSRIAVSLESPIRRLSMAINLLTTEGSTSKSKGATPGKYIEGARQQNVFEYICEPTYRLYVSLDDDALMDELEQRLSTGKSTYALSLGRSEHLAWYEYDGRYAIKYESGQASVRSVIPGEGLSIIPDSEAKYVSERMPAFMRAHDPGGRVADGSQQITYERRGDSIDVRDEDYAIVGGDTVVFS